MRVIAVLAALVVSCFAQDLHPGSTVPGFVANDPAGKIIHLGEFQGHVTVVAFISTTCPISNAFNDRLSALYRDYSAKGIQFIILNANANELPSAVAEHAKSAGFPFPVMKDAGNQAADLFGAMATPETYVIDSKGILRYHGYIDDSVNEARVKNRGLRSAIDAVLAGKPVAQPETKAFGCTIKRVRRTS